MYRVAMTARARGVAGSGGRRDAIGVAALARRLWTRAMRGVAAGAVRVAGAGRRVHALGVASRAGGRDDPRLAVVRDVACEARRGRVVLGRVARLACDGLGAGGERVRVRRMAPQAVAGGVRDVLVVAARARAWRIVMLRVARRARAVLVGGKLRLVAVAARARLDLGGAEPVRRVTAGALRVAGRQRAIVDMQLARLARMTAHAAGIRGTVGLVHLVAVETPAQTGVARLLLGVAARALLRLKRRRVVRPVAIRARLIGVRTDGGVSALRTVMAAHARRGRTGAERMTVAAAGRVLTAVQRRHHARVAALAEVRGRLREAVLAVTRRARDLADVRDVPGARRHGLVRRRHLLRRTPVSPARARRDEHEDDQAPHGRDPIG